MLTPRTGSTHLLLFHTFIVVVLLLTAKKPRRGWPRAERAAATWAIMAIDGARRGVCVCASDGGGARDPGRCLVCGTTLVEIPRAKRPQRQSWA